MHAYYPPLPLMRRYSRTGAQLRLEEVERPGEWECDGREGQGQGQSSQSRSEGRSAGPSRVDALLEEARAGLERLGPEQAAEAQRSGALLVDIRYAALRERDGTIPGALIVERNELEWRLDPSCPHRAPEATGLGLPVVVVCNEGYASSLAAARCTPWAWTGPRTSTAASRRGARRGCLCGSRRSRSPRRSRRPRRTAPVPAGRSGSAPKGRGELRDKPGGTSLLEELGGAPADGVPRPDLPAGGAHSAQRCPRSARASRTPRWKVG